MGIERAEVERLLRAERAAAEVESASRLALATRAVKAEVERLRAEAEFESSSADLAHDHCMTWRARAEKAEAERDAYRKPYAETPSGMDLLKRARDAEAERDAAREALARVEAFVAAVEAGTAEFMESYERAGEGVSRRMSGETAAMIVQERSVIAGELRAALAQPATDEGADQ